MSSGSSVKKYTMAEVEKHNQRKNLWIVINKGVYDISKFQKEVSSGKIAWSDEFLAEIFVI